VNAESSTSTDDGSSKTALRIPPQRIGVVINPAAGRERAILRTLNSVLKELEIEWDAAITHRKGDARRLAEKAAAAGVDAVAIYGGDGSVLEAATGLRGSGVPLAILPGGTANVLSRELGIPSDLTEALYLLDEGTIRGVDMGKVGDQMFFHLGIGFEAEMIKKADRKSKERSGTIAYIFSALRELRSPPTALFTLELDDQTVEMEGINCLVTTFGSIGVAGLKLSKTIDVSDGLLDVIVLSKADFNTFLSVATGALSSGEIAHSLKQWQIRTVRITAEPPQAITVDGEIVELDDLSIEVVPEAVRIFVSPPED
jgi:diacylglycerol kinase (ATP)